MTSPNNIPSSPQNPFKEGVIIFFRAFAPSGEIARSVLPRGRTVEMDNPDYPFEDYLVKDEAGVLLGVFPREWVSAILPIETVGPANAPDSSQ